MATPPLASVMTSSVSSIINTKSWVLGSGQPSLVSVIVPTFNRSHLILETLDSVWNQTYRPIELIIVDDGSTDDTQIVVKNWVKDRADKRDFRVHIVRQENRGAPSARNHGIRLSRGEFIQFLDSDDVLHPLKIFWQVKHLQQNHEAGFAYGPVYEIENPHRIIYAQSSLTTRQAVLKQLIVPTFTTLGPLSRRSMIEHVGPWNETLKCDEDWEYFSRATVMECRPGYVPDAKSYYRAMSGAMRVRWMGQPQRLGEHIEAQFRRLDSFLEYAAPSFKNDVIFRRLIAWQWLQTTAKSVVYRWEGDDAEQYRRAKKIAYGGLPSIVAATVLWVHRIAGKRAAAYYFLIYPWLYFKYQALIKKSVF